MEVSSETSIRHAALGGLHGGEKGDFCISVVLLNRTDVKVLMQT